MPDLSIFQHADAWVSLLTLTALEIVLGIDNIVFISILTGKLPERQQPAARSLGLSLALLMRIGLLFAISWVMSLEEALFTVMGHAFSGRDLILIGGGMFLVAKSTHEIFDRLEVEKPDERRGGAGTSMALVLVQIMLLDVVFSLDSVITAVGMARHLLIMVMAVVIAVVIMLVFVGSISAFVNRHPSMKVLALSFLLLIGVVLVADGLGQHINKGYVYFAMAFSLAVELVNLRIRRAQQAPVTLHEKYPPAAAGGGGAAA